MANIMHLRRRAVQMLWGSSLILGSAIVVEGAELRSSSGQRPIRREVSHVYAPATTSNANQSSTAPSADDVADEKSNKVSNKKIAGDSNAELSPEAAEQAAPRRAPAGSQVAAHADPSEVRRASAQQPIPANARSSNAPRNAHAGHSHAGHTHAPARSTQVSKVQHAAARPAPSHSATSHQVPATKATSRRAVPAQPAAMESSEIEMMDDGVMYEDMYDAGMGDWCEGGCCDVVCGPCGNGMWADVDVLIWRRRERFFPPLLTTSPDATAFANAGILPNATVLFGGQGEGGEGRPGGRINFGTWLNPCQSFGVGGRFFALGDEEINLTQSSTGSPILAIPFFDEVLNRENALVLSYPTAPDQRTGSISINSTSQVLGADAYGRWCWYNDGCGRVDFIAGYQHSRIDEDLTIAASSTVPGAFRQDPTDIFATTNEYHAGTIGFMSQVERGSWKLTSLIKVGFGNMTETVTISGRNEIRTPPDSTTPTFLDAGLFTQASNIGQFQQTEFAVSPEVNVNWVCHVTENVDVSVGYTFLYWNNVVQPGNHIDRRINDQQTELLPRFQFSPDEYWVYGVNLGTQIRF